MSVSDWMFDLRPLPDLKKKERKQFRLNSNDFGCICDGVSNVDGYEKNAR